MITKGEKHFYFNLTKFHGRKTIRLLCVQGFRYGVEKNKPKVKRLQTLHVHAKGKH